MLIFSSSASLIGQQQLLAYFIGEHQEHYHQLSTDHSTSLLEVCEFDMNKSYAEWYSLMHDFEQFAIENDFDLSGVKLWINVFWDKAGTIETIVFHEKPNSKLADYNTLKSLMAKFVALGYEGKNHQAPYSHYGSISFPLINSAYLAKEK